MTTHSKKFGLTFYTGNGQIIEYPKKAWKKDVKDFMKDKVEAGITIAENQDILVKFLAKEKDRMTMDGLDVAESEKLEKKDGEIYIKPQRKKEAPLLIFSGKDFPLVPGYYVITVYHENETYYGLLEITPKFMEKQSWQNMREELISEIKTLSFDFMKRNIQITKAMESALGLNVDMLLRFYIIHEECDYVISVLDELAKTANTRLVINKKRVYDQNKQKSDVHIKPQHIRFREGSYSQTIVYMENTLDVEENRFVKRIIKKLHVILKTFIEELDKNATRLELRQEELREFSENREYKMGKKALIHFDDFRKRAMQLLNIIKEVEKTNWFIQTSDTNEKNIPMTVFLDPRYSILYKLHKNLNKPEESLSVSSFYRYQWKRTDKLYELWCFLQFIKALTKNGWEVKKGPSVEKKDGKYRLSSLESGTVICLKKEKKEVYAVYDGLIPETSKETSRKRNPIYTNNPHRQPDLRLDFYSEEKYCGSLIADFKYRDIYYLWQNEEKSRLLRRQFNAYRDVNTKYYKNYEEKRSLQDIRPVKEVWAIFPKEIPTTKDEDYNLRFISLAPSLASNAILSKMLEEYTKNIYKR